MEGVPRLPPQCRDENDHHGVINHWDDPPSGVFGCFLGKMFLDPLFATKQKGVTVGALEENGLFGSVFFGGPENKAFLVGNKIGMPSS